jgi:hypothetical protein
LTSQVEALECPPDDTLADLLEAIYLEVYAGSPYREGPGAAQIDARPFVEVALERRIGGVSFGGNPVLRGGRPPSGPLASVGVSDVGVTMVLLVSRGGP